MKRNYLSATVVTICVTMCLAISCNPYVEPGIELTGQVPSPDFTTQFDPDNANRVIVTSTGDTGFQIQWDFGNGTTSSLSTDTAYFPVMGDYEISLTVANAAGAGTTKQTVTILENDASGCADVELIRLCGGCADPDGNKWTWTVAAGAITVGSAPGLGDYFVSNENSLAPEQYDDFFNFLYEDFQYDYENNGLTIFPEDGFTPQPYTPNPDATWTLSPGTGVAGVSQIILSPPDMFLGTKDSGPVYDIIELTDLTMVLRSEIRGGGGWFEFHLVIVP